MARYFQKLGWLFLLGVIVVIPTHGAGAAFFSSSGDVTQYINEVYWFGAMIVGALAMMFIVLAGVNYMRASGNEEHVTKSKEMFAAALMGLFLVLGSFVLLRTLDPRLVELKLEITSVDLAKVTPTTNNNEASCTNDNQCLGAYVNFEYCGLPFTGKGSVALTLDYKCLGGKCVLPSGAICGSAGDSCVGSMDKPQKWGGPSGQYTCKSGTKCTLTKEEKYGVVLYKCQ
ncbi:pilin [Patescibacteria group bacterium]|nr:pilin [Patescibacteria group bacterium]